MSFQLNQKSYFWKDVLVSLRRAPIYRAGSLLSNRDASTFKEAILLDIMILVDQASDDKCRNSDTIRRWCNSIITYDITELDYMLKEVNGLLKRTNDPTTYDSFKHYLTCNLSLFGTYMAPINDYLTSYLQCPNSSDFKVLNQFLSFLTRITLRDVDFSLESIQEFKENEERVSHLLLDEQVVSEMRTVIESWLRDLDIIENFSPRHGPGSVAEIGVTSAYEKFKCLKSDVLLDHLILRLSNPDEMIPLELSKGLIRQSRVTFVPKSLSSMRTICMEPSTLMYFQQGVWDRLDDYLGHHPYLRRILRLHDQSQNRQMSQHGSLDDSFATIDLSKASDSVSWDLVKRIFSHTSYYLGCLATRSREAILPDGEIIPLAKFAPMGSALCFPTECLIFAAAAEVAVRRIGRTHCGDLHYSVYGDDIVIRTEYAPALVKILESIGFLVNKQKSFINTRFKESCGGEYFDGDDVTPLKISRKYTADALTTHSPSAYEGMIQLINSLQARQLKTARNFLLKKFSALRTQHRPIFDDGTRGISSEQPTNFHLRKRLNYALQRLEVCHGSQKMTYADVRPDDQYSLFMWFKRASARRVPLREFLSPEEVVRIEAKPKKKDLVAEWDPAPSTQFDCQAYTSIFRKYARQSHE